MIMVIQKSGGEGIIRIFRNDDNPFQLSIFDLITYVQQINSKIYYE